jgi:hypothetical protein
VDIEDVDDDADTVGDSRSKSAPPPPQQQQQTTSQIVGAIDGKKELDAIKALMISQDSARLVTLHSMVWQLMELSPSVSDELTALVNSTNHKLQFNHINHDRFYRQHTVTGQPRSSLSKELFDTAHERRLREHGLSNDALDELKNVMQLLWRVLYDPNAYQDPNYDQKKAAKLQLLFKDGPPKCCDEHMYIRASSNVTLD